MNLLNAILGAQKPASDPSTANGAGADEQAPEDAGFSDVLSAEKGESREESRNGSVFSTLTPPAGTVVKKSAASALPEVASMTGEAPKDASATLAKNVTGAASESRASVGETTARGRSGIQPESLMRPVDQSLQTNGQETAKAPVTRAPVEGSVSPAVVGLNGAESSIAARVTSPDAPDPRQSPQAVVLDAKAKSPATPVAASAPETNQMVRSASQSAEGATTARASSDALTRRSLTQDASAHATDQPHRTRQGDAILGADQADPSFDSRRDAPPTERTPLPGPREPTGAGPDAAVKSVGTQASTPGITGQGSASTSASAATANASLVVSGAYQATQASAAVSVQVGSVDPTAFRDAVGPRADASAIHQIVSAASSRSGAGTVEVLLDPPELGRIEISIDLADQGLRATLSAERQTTYDMIRRNLAELSQNFEDAGFSGIDLGFSGDHEGSDGGNSETASPRGHAADLAENNAARPNLNRLAGATMDLRL